MPHDWYRSSFGPDPQPLFWEHGAEEKLAIVLEALKLRGDERVLDLACATGRRTDELCRRGFNVIGIDVCEELLSIAGEGAAKDDLYPYFVEVDPREILFEDEFDLILSMGGGAFGHFETDEDDLRAFAAAARALRAGGRLLLQVPNVLHVEEHLPARTWLVEDEGGIDESVRLIEQAWDEATRRIDGTTRMILPGETLEYTPTVEFQRRLYSVEELAKIFESVDLRLVDVFDEEGSCCAPTDVQQELFVEGRKA